ncbi:MAG: DUF5131 family protein [Syntrophomonadaceae bacterium]|nr:DUF5131 family protein [Syntrophomonadaceae bacterium]
MATANWNPWHGCHKLSAGCQNCYVYRADARHERDASHVYLTRSFDFPLKKSRDGSYKIGSGSLVWTCFTSDFLLEDADEWRAAAWAMMRQRSDCTFLFITKRIDRFMACIPDDWGAGYPNVQVCCTVENQAMADYRLPFFAAAPIVHKSIVSEPLLGPIDLTPHLGTWVRQVVVGGESGERARVCRYGWVLDIRRQCVERGIPFRFKQTGAKFEKDGKLYRIKRPLQHAQARKAAINWP